MELCFIVSQAQGFRILLPNAEGAERRRRRRLRRLRRRQQLLPGKAHRAGAAASGLRPPGRRGARGEAGRPPRPHVMDRASRSTPGALLPPPGLLVVQSEAAGVHHGARRLVAAAAAAERRRWAQEVRLVFYLLGKTPTSERERGWDPGKPCLVGSRGKRLGARAAAGRVQKRPRGR